MKIEDAIRISPAMLNKFHKINIKTIYDLLLFLPVSFQDKRYITPINQVSSGHFFQIEGTIKYVNNQIKPKKINDC